MRSLGQLSHNSRIPRKINNRTYDHILDLDSNLINNNRRAKQNYDL